MTGARLAARKAAAPCANREPPTVEVLVKKGLSHDDNGSPRVCPADFKATGAHDALLWACAREGSCGHPYRSTCAIHRAPVVAGLAMWQAAANIRDYHQRPGYARHRSTLYQPRCCHMAIGRGQQAPSTTSG